MFKLLLCSVITGKLINQPAYEQSNDVFEQWHNVSVLASVHQPNEFKYSSAVIEEKIYRFSSKATETRVQSVLCRLGSGQEEIIAL